MSEQAEVKSEALPDLDDLLQCPVCYEIPTGQIFQCNEGHHVCGRCKMRLDVCPVCRALFFGTRNYAMEELIANVRKLRAFKLGGKVTTDSTCNNNTPAKVTTEEVPEVEESADDDASEAVSNQSTTRPPPACKGVFRCMSCKTINGVRLPAGRLLNHLRYYHSPELIEGKSENGEYVQAWQFSTVPGRIVTAVRVSDMGIFFFIIEICNDSVCAWLLMAASPWVAHEFCYTITICGNDREAIFSDSVWSVKACEGTLKNRGHCLLVNGRDARALTAPATLSCKLSVRRTPPEQLQQVSQPRAVLRVANRSNNRDNNHSHHAHDLEPFLQDLQNDVARLSRAFATLGLEAHALVRSEAEMRARIENRHNSNSNERPEVETRARNENRHNSNANERPEAEIRARNDNRHASSANQRPEAEMRARNENRNTSTANQRPETELRARIENRHNTSANQTTGNSANVVPTIPNNPDDDAGNYVLSRNGRRRMRQRLRAALNETQPPALQMPPVPAPRAINQVGGPQRQNSSAPDSVHRVGLIQHQPIAAVPLAPPPVLPPVPPSSSSGPSNGLPENGNVRANKKKRRQRK